MTPVLLREAQVLLRKYAAALEATTEGVPPTRVVVTNVDALRTALEAVKDIPLLSTRARQLLTFDVFKSDNGLVASELASKQVLPALNTLRSEALVVQRFLDAALGDPPPYYISVRFPGDQPELGEASKAAQKFFEALEVPVQRLGWPPLRITLAEPGSSIWELASEIPDVVKFLGSLVGLGIGHYTWRTAQAKLATARAEAEQTVHKERQEAHKERQEEHKAEQEMWKAKAAEYEFRVKELELEEAESKNAQQRNELATERALRQFTSSIADLGTRNEADNSIRIAVKSISELYEDGAEVRLQIDAPKEVAEHFPPEALPERRGITPKILPKLPSPPQLGPKKDDEPTEDPDKS